MCKYSGADIIGWKGEIKNKIARQSLKQITKKMSIKKTKRFLMNSRRIPHNEEEIKNKMFMAAENLIEVVYLIDGETVTAFTSPDVGINEKTLLKQADELLDLGFSEVVLEVSPNFYKVKDLKVDKEKVKEYLKDEKKVREKIKEVTK
jgi:hypothetical protein